MERGQRSAGARLGAVGVLVAVSVFVVTFLVAITNPGTTYVWPLNMISDLGDHQCRVRGGRWICSPGHGWFNVGLIVTGAVLAASGLALRRAWGTVLSGGVVVMGAGLVVAGVFPAGETAAPHLAGVILALVPPGIALLMSAIRPQLSWLSRHRVMRGALGAAALALCAESRLPHALIPAGAGEIVIVGCLMVPLVVEAIRLLTTRGVVAEPVSR